MESIQKYFNKEKIKQFYEVLLEDRKLLITRLNDINQVIDVAKHYFDTGEVLNVDKLKKMIEDYDD